jgi:predicted O-linked N-acetylglucosamine transferase (SPINDLY family)
MDYIVADEFVIPPASRGHYSEQVVYMPFSFQVNDSKRRIDAAPILRKDHGLPENAMVFCSFNNTYKLNPGSFDVWARVMRRVDDSVLWLLADNEATARNLQREAAARGVPPERLVFAGRCDYAHHLKRLSLADLFLDSLPFNAGTTASDSLWAGVPLITCAGRSFAGRMSGSLLRALGLPELIAEDASAFEELAVNLANNPEALGALREKLAAQRLSQPLFDTALYARHLESAFSTMLAQHSRGEPPRSFYVAE